MNPEQRAEKIFLILQLPQTYNEKNGIPAMAYNAVGREIKEAEREAYERGFKEALKDGIKEMRDGLFERGYKEGFREAIEKAAKLLEDESTRLIKDSVNHADIIRSYIDCLAQLIRAMSEAKPEVSNDESL